MLTYIIHLRAAVVGIPVVAVIDTAVVGESGVKFKVNKQMAPVAYSMPNPNHR